MSAQEWWVLVVAGIAAVVMVWLHCRHVKAVRRDRVGLFESAAGVLDDVRVIPRGLDFPVLYGSFEGRAVRVEPVVDTISLRIIPVLRLVVTVRDHLPGQSWVSVLSDETGQEFYARHRGMQRLRDPEWPARVSVACAAVDDVNRDVMDGAVAVVVRDSSVKQILLTDRGVRCVVRAAQSDAATYRVTRRVDLSGVRVPAELLRGAVRATASLCDQAGRRTTSGRVGAW